MNVDDIDLTKTKVVVFDFDDMLAIHKFPSHKESTEEDDIAFYAGAYYDPENFYNVSSPRRKSEALAKLIPQLRARNIKMYCLSGMQFSFHLKAKQTFVDQNYGSDIKVFTSGTQELKVLGVKVLQRINQCELTEITFFDDDRNTVEILRANNIRVVWMGDLIDDISV